MIKHILRNNYDIIIPWIFAIFSFLFLYPLNILFILIFPIVIGIYKKRSNILIYRKYNLKTKINFILFWFGLIFIVLIPISGADYLYNSYQKNIIFSCYNLKHYTENDFIKKTHLWYKSEDSLPLLLDKVSECHISKATPFLAYLIIKAPHTSNPLNDFHAMGSKGYGNLPQKVFLKLYPNVDINEFNNINTFSDTGHYILNYYKTMNPNFDYNDVSNSIFLLKND